LLHGIEETRLVVEMMSASIPPRDRLAILHGVLQAVIEKTGPNALVFKFENSLLEPKRQVLHIYPARTLRGRPPLRRPRFFPYSVTTFHVAHRG
jgi:hypothetical protein